MRLAMPSEVSSIEPKVKVFTAIKSYCGFKAVMIIKIIKSIGLLQFWVRILKLGRVTAVKRVTRLV
jgi:hypothetical protein